MLDRAAARFPDRLAIVFKHERVTYAQLKRRVDDFARGLLARGLGPGDHVVLWMPNCVEWNVANLGVAKIGGVTVTCNSRYKALEVGYVLRQSDATALIMMDRLAAAGIDYVEILRGLCPEAERPGGPPAGAHFPALRHLIVLGAGRSPAALAFEDVESSGRADAAVLDAIPIRPEDPVEMLYTSGTTGEPKGCLLSHGNMYFKCRVYADLHSWTPEDRYLVPVPYFHIFGSMGGIAANCLVGSTQVVMDVFDPLEAMRLIEAERVTIFSGVPTMFITILGHPAFGLTTSARCGRAPSGRPPSPSRSCGRSSTATVGSAWTRSSSTGSPRPPGAPTGRGPAIPSTSVSRRWGCAPRRSRTRWWTRPPVGSSGRGRKASSASRGAR
jgi:fatty-acyl-CoA synthase